MKVIQEIAALCKGLNAAKVANNTELIQSISKQLSDIEAVHLPLGSGIVSCSIIKGAYSKDKVELSVQFDPMNDVGYTLKTQWLRVVVKPCLIDMVSIRVLGNISKWDKETVNERMYFALTSEIDIPW
jgi:hypothetical protein